ncbi:MAG: DinB family protein [Anaerolineales bacterium]
MAAPAKVDELVERFGRNLDAFKSIKRDCLDQRCYAFSNLIHRDQNMNLSRMFYHWRQVRSDLLATMDKFSDDELTFVPFNASRAVGQIMLHIAGAEEGWFRYVIGRGYDEWPPEYSLADYPDIGSIKALLTKVHTRTEAYLDTQDLADLECMIDAPWGKSIPLGWIIWHVLEHEIHHRGELSLILGLLGREGLDV